jgi:multidrug efflux pump subunit AcrA (membrane-fusion protein)
MKPARLLLAATLLAAAGAAWFFLGARTEVNSAAVVRETAVDAVPAVVKVDPEFQVTVTSDVTGLVTASRARLGQIVRESDVIFEIDPNDYRIELARLEAQLANTRDQFALDFETRNALQRQQEDLANFERRTREGDYPELEMRRRRDEFRIFTEQIERDRLARERLIADLEHAIRLQRDAIEKCVIRSPASGTITELFAQPGEVVAVRAPLVRLYSEALQVEARINEEDFSGIRISLDASVRFLAYGPELYPAKVVKVLPNADPLNQQYRAYLEVQIPAERLIPGLSGEASIIRNRRAGSLLAPRSALKDGAVFVIENGVARRRPVTVGFRGLNVFEILEGANEGDRLATSGLDSLRDGSRVSIRK